MPQAIFDRNDPEEREWAEFWGNDRESWLAKNPDNVTRAQVDRAVALTDKAFAHYENVHDTAHHERSEAAYLAYLHRRDTARAAAAAFGLDPRGLDLG